MTLSSYLAVLLLGLLGLTRFVICDTECAHFDYLNNRRVEITDRNLARMNFVFSDMNHTTYFKVCGTLDPGIVNSFSGLNIDGNKSYSFISCESIGCFGLQESDIVMALTKKVSKAISSREIVEIVYKHPLRDSLILISFPDYSITAGSGLATTVLLNETTDSSVEYEPKKFLNYSMRVSAADGYQIVDTYLYGPSHYYNSWLWAIIGASFMLSSACFHNFQTTSGRLSSFTFFIIFYVFYRSMDTFYCISYSPYAWIATTSAVIFPGMLSYIITYFDKKGLNYFFFGKLCSLSALLTSRVFRCCHLLLVRRLDCSHHRRCGILHSHFRVLPHQSLEG